VCEQQTADGDSQYDSNDDSDSKQKFYKVKWHSGRKRFSADLSDLGPGMGGWV
jgi:hypothetical protein